MVIRCHEHVNLECTIWLNLEVLVKYLNCLQIYKDIR